MKDKDYIKELFSEKLSSHEVPVRSDLWSGIQSQLGNTATTAAAAKGISVAAKWAIGIASSVVVAGSVVWFASGDADQPKVKEQLAKTEESTPVLKSETEKRVSESTIYSAPHVAEEDHDQPAGTVTMHDNGSSVVAKDGGTTVPLIVKQRQDEVVNASATNNGASDKGNQGAATAGGATQTAGSSVNSGETATASKSVVGKIKWVNVFTPNNDQDNDYFELENSNLKDFSITVFDAKMQPVYTSSDKGFKWNGMFRENPLPEGSYGYMVIATDDNGNLIKEFKNLTIKR